MALRYWVGGGSSANWNATGNTNWGTASGVQDNASVPTSVDDVIFDGAGAGGNTNSTISATITVKSLTINAGYTATMTHNAVLTIAGNWTMSNTHTIAGASGIILSGGTTTITSGGQTWPNDLTFSYSITYNTITLVGNFICGGTTVITGGYGKTVNKTTSETYTTKGITLTNGYIDGTAEKILSGGTWQGTGGAIGGLLTFDSGVNTTIISGVVTFNGTILKYTSGTVTTTASTLTLSAGTQTLNTSGITWNDVVCSFPSFASTITLTSNFVCTGSTTFSGGYSTAINKTASETWTSNGLVISGKSLSGTSEFILSGGTWSSTGSSASINLTFAGNVTVSGNVYYLTGILKYTSGTVTTTGSTLNIAGGCTLNANGITWNNATFTAAGTTTLTSNFTCTGTTTITAFYNPIINKTASETWSTNGLSVLGSNSVSGTAEIILTGGTWVCAGFNSGVVSSSLTFAGNVTVSGIVTYRTGTLKYSSGTVTTTGSTLDLNTTCTLNTNGITWNNVRIIDNGTYTLTSNFLCNGVFTMYQPLGSFALNRTTAETLRINGGIVLNSGMVGTAEIILGGGTWSAAANCYIGHNLTIDGNVTLSGTVNYGYGSGDKTLKYLSGTVTTAGSTLNLSGPYPSTMYLDTNGITWNNVTIIDNGIYTITSNFICNGLFRMFQTLGAFSLNRTASQTFVVNGGISLNNGTSGTAEITLRGGTWSASLNCAVSNNLFLDGNITISGTVYFNGPGTLKYLSGVITTASSTLSLSGGISSPYNVTLDTNGITWNNVTMGNNGNIVLNSDFLCNGLFSIIVGLGLFSFNRSASQVARFNGGISIGSGCSGTAQITLGGGTWSGTANVSNSLVIDGNITISTGSGKYLTGTITGTTGTVTGTLLLQGACTFNCTGVNWGTLSFDAGATYTVNSLLSASVIQPNINGVTFAGTAGWTCATYNHAATSAQAVTLKDGVTYTITGALNAYQSRNGSSISIASSSASLRANLVLLAGATCNCLANLTRIDASGGRPIYTFNGTVTDCLNVKSFNDLTTIASSYVNL